MVPITLTVRTGTMMSPSVGIWQRLTTVFTSRWFIATMIPRPGITWTPSIPANSAIRPAHAPEALTVIRAATSSSSPVVLLRSRAPVTRSPSRWIADRLVIGQDPSSAMLGAARQPPHELPHVDAAVGHAERAGDPRVQPRLLALGPLSGSISSQGTPVALQPAANRSA